MKKEFKMNLLNAEEMKGVTGGATVCSKAGDTIFCDAKNNTKLCATYEVKCDGGTMGHFTIVLCGQKVDTWHCTGSTASFTTTCTSGHLASVEVSDAIAVVAPLDVSITTPTFMTAAVR
jgi:hypothetical protein